MLKRFCASLAIALLIFSVSLVPASADIFDTSSAEYVLDLYIAGIDQDPTFVSHPVHINGNGENSIIEPRTTSVANYPLKFASNYFEPKDYDRTIFVSVGLTSNDEAWFNGVDSYVNKPDIRYADSRDDGASTSSVHVYEDGVTYFNDVYQIFGTHGEIFNFKITVPAYSNAFRFETTELVVFSAEPTWTISSFGGFIIDTADDALLDAVLQILANTQSMDSNISTMVTAINQILEQMRELNADTDTIISLLESLQDLNERELTQLENISSSVDAIYYFLTQSLKDESDKLSQEAGDVAGAIDNNGQAEEYYQTSMQGSYDSLDLDNFSFGGITGGMELVGRIFSDIWSAFGEYNILFTYPLILGIALLVIGRLSKTGGGNSSRNVDHKGGEGGA